MLWHISRTARLSWAEFPDQRDVAAVFHSGNGQTIAVDPLGRAILKQLEARPTGEPQLFSALIEQRLLPDNPAGLQQLSFALRRLHGSAIVNYYWPQDDTQAS